MANKVTMLEALINPQVMADMVSYELEQKLRVTNYYDVDRTLTGRAGDTITIPAFKYIGMAEDVGENEAVPSREMATEDISYTVKKAAIEVTLTDEAVLSGHGDVVGETTKQLRMSIMEKIDFDGLTALRGITPVNGLVFTATGALSYDEVVDAMNLLKMEEQGENLTLLINKNALTTIRKDDRFFDRMTAGGDRVFFTGQVGTIAGCSVVISNRLEDGESYILTQKCLTAFMKRDINIEREREMSYKRTKIGADAHYTVAITDYDKIVKIEFVQPTKGK